MNPQTFAKAQKDLRLPRSWVLSCSFQKGQPLRIEKQGAKIALTYGREVEAYRALSLLKIHEKERVFRLEETPRFSSDGVMLDCSRNGVMSLPRVKDFIEKMAFYGLDTLLLYTEDTFTVPEYPYFGYQRGRYSKEEIQTIDAYAASFGIELVPCIETLGHLFNPLLWTCFASIKENDNVLLADEPKTYEFIENEIKACRACFHSNKIHLGLDEAMGVGLGRHYELHGYEDPNVVFLRHLEKVKGICQRYSFTPMIWSDMPFRLANKGDYYGPNPVPEKVREAFPTEVGLVYWDYYHDDEAFYERMLSAHKEFHNPVFFAGGSWRWTGFAPHIGYSLLKSRAALEACLKVGIPDVFVTGWGDNGNEAAFASMYPCLALYAEFGYEGQASDQAISALLQAVNGETLDRMLLLDLPNQPDGTFKHGYGNPSKYLFYQDVIGGIFDKHIAPCYRKNYAAYAKKLHAAASASRENAYAYECLARLCAVLKDKYDVGARLREAYKKGDKKALSAISKGDLPLILKEINAFKNALEKQWNAECKPFGFDVLDGRMGWLMERVKTAAKRLDAYEEGTLDAIPELGEELLWQDGRKEKGESEVMSWNWWEKTASVNPM
jgi:hexosaminidase